MPITHQVPREFHQAGNVVQSNRRLSLFLAMLLVAFSIYLASSALLTTGAEVQASLSNDDGETLAAASPTPNECLANVAWPAAFQIPFTAYVNVPGRTSPTAWKNNMMYYQYDQASGTAYFKSQFPKCPNLTGVPLSFYGERCEFYFQRDPQNPNQYQAYVYSTKWHKYFLLAQNFGPQFQDFVARYQELLSSCLSAPPAKAHLPVGNPPGVAVNWFITSGHRGVPAKGIPPKEMHLADLGYYAAIATPTNGYKPPYSFGGAPPGVHKPGSPPTRFVPGQLVYDWQSFSIVDSFPSGTFTPPSDGYTEIPKCVWTTVPKPMNCAACHMTDLPNGITFYIQQRRPGGCPKPSPTPLK